MSDMTTKAIKIEARIPLDAEGLGRKKLALAEVTVDLAKEKQDAKEASSASRKRQKEMTASAKRISEEILKESTTGMIDAEERWDFDRFEVVTVRLDTAEVVSTRAMSAEERQTELPIDLDAAPSEREPAKVVKIRGGGKKKPAQPDAH